MQQVRFQSTTDLNPSTESEWIARLLLYFITFSEHKPTTLDDCAMVWKDYVIGTACVGTRAAICNHLANDHWPPALQRAFIDHVYPFLLKLLQDRLLQLR